MSFRSILFAVFAGLLLMLLGLQWALLNAFTKDASHSMDELAYSTSFSAIQLLPQAGSGMDVAIDLSGGPQRKPSVTFEPKEAKTGAACCSGVPNVSVQVSRKQPDGSYANESFVSITSNGVTHKIPIPKGGFENLTRKLSNQMAMVSLATLAVGLILCALIAHRIARPLKYLEENTRELGQGALGRQIPLDIAGRNKELQSAVRSFNTMSTQLAELEARNRQLQDRQHEHELSEIARGVAHTLRNPLNALSLTIDELARGDPARKSGLQQMARRQIQRIDQWIRSFMTLMGGGALETSQVPVVQLIRRLIDSLQLNDDSQVRIDLSSEVDDVTIDGIEAEISTILQSLLSNAVEASDAGGEVRVHVVAPDPAFVEVSIADCGAGIDPDVKTQLFMPHVTNKPQGSGMGLFIAQRLAKTRYGGEISLESNTPRGTVARLKLARARTQA